MCICQNVCEPCPGCLPARVDPNLGSEETVRSPGVLRPANGISGVVSGALPVESTSQTARTNSHGTKTGVPPRKARGRKGACELAPDSFRERKMDGTTRGGTAELTSRDQNTRQERGQGKRDKGRSHKEEEILGAETEAAKQSRATPPATKRNEESSTCA